ncbi:MAG: intradiol ring-cleavage dioxygenase [Chitinophagaceae bacterium]|jgi:protocatechuate 3,4-dioxygenase beta subunit|nr:intradiol ring-cleavage dioxygenase [Chitinophagaceae bacterium]
MERKDFIRNGMKAVGFAVALPALASCKKEISSTGTDTLVTPSSCVVGDTETDGPYPLYASRGSAIQRVDMTDGKQGIPLSITIAIRNVNNSCSLVANARVDLWHCDKDGYYSGYSNTGYLGTQNNAGLVFCRGLQYTDASGQAKFTSIYPGWYSGRAIHIHAQVYVGGSLKLTTQIAFPDAINAEVCKTTLYATHGQPDTTNTTDSILRDSLDNELATVTKNSSGGYDLVHTIYIAA